MTLQDRIGALVAAELQPKTFSTGSTGYHATGKVTDGEQRYQISCTAVLIGSRPDKPPKAAK